MFVSGFGEQVGLNDIVDDFNSDVKECYVCGRVFTCEFDRRVDSVGVIYEV